MKRNLKIAVIASAIIIAAAGCKTTQKPTTPEQKAASGRGVKLDQEECEKLAMENPKRASGIGLSQSERLAKNSATLDARNNLTAAIQTVLVGMIKNFDQEHQAGAGKNKQSDFVNQTGEEQKGIINSTISSTVICSNTYVQEDGSYKVYACVEMSDGSIGALYNKLSNDKKISIQYEEKKFREEMDKELDALRNRQ